MHKARKAENRGRRPRAGVIKVLGEGQQLDPPHQLGGLGRCELPQRGSGQSNYDIAEPRPTCFQYYSTIRMASTYNNANKKIERFLSHSILSQLL